MKKTEFPLQKYFKVVIYPSEVGWKQVWNDADASWEIICCKAFLRAGEPQPLPRAKAGGWDIAGRDEPELVLSQEKEEGRGKAASVPSQEKKKKKGELYGVRLSSTSSRPVSQKSCLATSVVHPGQTKASFWSLFFLFSLSLWW